MPTIVSFQFYRINNLRDRGKLNLYQFNVLPQKALENGASSLFSLSFVACTRQASMSNLRSHATSFSTMSLCKAWRIDNKNKTGRKEIETLHIAGSRYSPTVY